MMSSSVGPRRTSRPRTPSASSWKGRASSLTLPPPSYGGGSGRGTAAHAMMNRGRSCLLLSPTLTLSRLTGEGDWVLRQAPGEDALLGVQSVFRLVEHHRLRSIDHVGCHFLAAMR